MRSCFFALLLLEIKSTDLPKIYHGKLIFDKTISGVQFSINQILIVSVRSNFTLLYIETSVKAKNASESSTGMEGSFSAQFIFKLPDSVNKQIANALKNDTAENIDIPSIPQKLESSVGLTLTFIEFSVSNKELKVNSLLSLYPLKTMYLRFILNSENVYLEKLEVGNELLTNYNLKKQLGPVYQL